MNLPLILVLISAVSSVFLAVMTIRRSQMIRERTQELSKVLDRLDHSHPLNFPQSFGVKVLKDEEPSEPEVDDKEIKKARKQLEKMLKEYE